MHWHTHACHVATTSHPLSSSPPRQWRTNKCPPCNLHTRPLPLRHRCCALLRVRALPSLCHRAEPSPPSLPPCVGPRCPQAMRGYKRRPLPIVCPRPHRCLPPVSHPGRASPLFSATSLAPSHLTPPLSPYTGPRASPEPRAAPQPEGPAPSPPLNSGVVDRAGEFCPSIARRPHCELGLSIMLGECTMGWGSLRCTPCCGLAASEPS
jgi:hypothetical protein